MAESATVPETSGFIEEREIPAFADAPVIDRPAALEEVTPRQVQTQSDAHFDIEPEEKPSATPVALDDAPAEVVIETAQVSERMAASSQDTHAPVPPPLELDLPSDLVQIETDKGKADAAAMEPQHEPAPRARRVRPSLPPVSDEPLMQVETHGGSTLPAAADRERNEPVSPA